MSAFGSGPSNGQFWYGSTTNFPGFLYKKNVGVGGRRSTKMNPGGGITCNSATDLYNKYKPGGGGVGASSTANRRAKNRLATICGSSNKCFPCYNTLGQYSNYTHNPNGFVPCPGTINISSGSSPTPGPSPSGTYTVTYLGNTNTGGTAPTDGSSPYNSGSSVPILGNSGTLARTGYQFGGWNTAADGSGTNYVGGDTFNITQNTTLYANWIIGGVRLLYDPGTGGSGTPPPSSGTTYPTFSTQPVVDNTGTFTRSGFTFAGWNTSALGTGTSYPAGSNVTMANINSLITLYAQWTPVVPSNVNLTYNVNGGTGTDIVTPYNLNTAAPISGQPGTFTNGSLIFYGWNTLQNPTTSSPGISYPAGSTITMNASKTLYAQWGNSPLVTVTYNANTPIGATTSGVVPAAPTTYPTGVQVPILGQGSLITPGYTFLGWNDASGNGSLYSTGFTFTSKTVTLFAQWAPGTTVLNYGPDNTYTNVVAASNSWYNITNAQIIADTPSAPQTITIYVAALFGKTQADLGTGTAPYGIKSFTNKTVITSGSITSNTYTTYLNDAANNNFSQTITNGDVTYWPSGQTISSISFPTINTADISSSPATLNYAAARLTQPGRHMGVGPAFYPDGPTFGTKYVQFYFFNQGIQLNFSGGSNTKIISCPISALYTPTKSSTSAWAAMPKSYYPYVGVLGANATSDILTNITVIPSTGSQYVNPTMPNFTIQYDPNGANGPNAFFNETGLPAPQYFAPYNTDITPTPPTFPITISGNTGPLTKSTAPSTFNGWNTKADGTGTPYGPTTVNPTYNGSSGNLILYAQWV
jgi:uncharacterized repeat protein (TIGR02543 family)